MSYVSRVITAIALIALALALWHLREVLVVTFGALLVATCFGAWGELLARLLHIRRRNATILGIVLVIAIGAGFLWFAGAALAAQFRDLGERLPAGLASVRAWLAHYALGSHLLSVWDDLMQQGIGWKRVESAAGVTLNAVAGLVLVLLSGLFIAIEPGLYRDGALRLLPRSQRDRVADAFDACAQALRGWLRGQALSMAFVGVATGTGLWLLDVPLALVMGVLAGLLDFVPWFGPAVSGSIAVLLAILQGPHTALYVLVLALVIHQLEGNVVVPLAQRHTVHLPPALGVLAVVVAGGLFGIVGVLFAMPATVVAMVLTEKLYVQGVLER